VRAIVHRATLRHVNVGERYRALVAELEADGVRLVTKDRVWHQKLIGALLGVIGQNVYVERYVTTLGRTIYLTPDWERRTVEDRYATLRHERVHLEQFRRWGFLPMAIAYLLLPLPFGLAWCRMRLERAAYEESVRVWHELGGRAATDRMRDHVIRQFTSVAYGWMWPFPRSIARWYDGLVNALSRS
jgi:hypothetical protein